MKHNLVTLLKSSSFVGLILMSHTSLAANVVTTPMRYAQEVHPMSSGVQLAQNNDCDQARSNADTCWNSWQDIGGGDDGQAGTFKQCVEVYCKLLQAHGCDSPDIATCE